MATYTINISVGSYGSVNLDVEVDVDRNDPNFMNALREKASKMLIEEIENCGDVEFVY